MRAGLGRLDGRDRAGDHGGVPAVELRSFEQAADVGHDIIVRLASKARWREILVLALAGFKSRKCLRYSGIMNRAQIVSVILVRAVVGREVGSASAGRQNCPAATCVVYKPAEIPVKRTPDPNYSIHFGNNTVAGFNGNNNNGNVGRM